MPRSTTFAAIVFLTPLGHLIINVLLELHESFLQLHILCTTARLEALLGLERIRNNFGIAPCHLLYT